MHGLHKVANQHVPHDRFRYLGLRYRIWLSVIHSHLHLCNHSRKSPQSSQTESRTSRLTVGQKPTTMMRHDKAILTLAPVWRPRKATVCMDVTSVCQCSLQKMTRRKTLP